MPDEPNPSLWSELKDRKVVRVAMMYAVVAWGIVVGGSELTQILELPVWVPKLVLVLAVLGFPVALVLAWAFELTPEGVRRAEPLPSPTAPRPSRKPFIAGVAVGVSAITLVAFLVREEPAAGPTVGAPTGGLDTDLVAILPFRYTGPAELDYLGDGVSQLLAARFTGDVGPRATDPTATTAVWDEASAAEPTSARRAVAERLGAGLVMTGGVLAGPDGLTLNASLHNLARDREVAVASAQGPVDSLTAVVERLTGGILSLSVGEYPESLAQLTSADPDALREYLRGQVEFRNGRHFTARDHFARAVEYDSTFALAAIWAADAANNVPGAPSTPFLELAARHGDRLTERDRVYVRARLGPRHPEPETRNERRRAYEEAARLMPDRANVWYWLGESTVHFPRDAEDPARALQYFQRAVELDPANSNAIVHLRVASSVLRDTEASIDAAERLAALDTSRVSQLYPRLLRAIASGDSAAFWAIEDSARALPLYSPPLFDAPHLVVAEWQITALRQWLEEKRASLTPSDPFVQTYYYFFYYAYQDLGLPEQADGVLTEYERATGTRFDRMRVLDAVYGALPEGVGQAAATRLEADLDALSESQWALEPTRDLTAVEMSRILRGEMDRVAETVQRLRATKVREPEAYGVAIETMALMLEAMVQARRGDAAARATVEAFDELFLQGPSFPVELYDAFVLATSDVYERLGDPEMALRVLARESNFNNFRWPYEARFARERGRLAAVTGDTERAIREYEHYTRLRSQASHDLQADVQAVRAELERLRGS